MTRNCKTVTTLEEWAKVQALGSYEDDYKNGELWEFNGELYYLSHLSLKPQELHRVVDFYQAM